MMLLVPAKSVNIQLLTIVLLRHDIHQRIPILTEVIAEVNTGIQWWISTSYPISQQPTIVLLYFMSY